MAEIDKIETNVKRRITYFYHPEVGNFHYGSFLFCFLIANFYRASSPNEASEAGSLHQSGRKLRNRQRDGNERS